MSRRKSKSRDERDEREERKGGVKGGYSKRGRNSATSRTRKPNDRNTRDNNDMGTKDRPTTLSVSSSNDPAWYSRSPEQVTNSANISFMDALGKPFGLWPNASSGSYAGGVQYGAPGVMRIGYVPTFGNPLGPTDPINVAMNKTYSEIRYANSGSRNYDAADYMKYLAVMDSAYAYAGYLKRVYGFINSYSSVNRYWPEQFYAAMRLNYGDIKDNIAQLRTYINNYISKVNSLAVPNNLPIFERHYWMCLNIYMDANSPWSQTYIMTPEVYAKYNLGSGNVHFYALEDPSTLTTFADLVDIGDDIIDSIMSTQDFYIMSGDTIKAFGGSLFQVEGITADFVQYPIYDAAVLNQIMNGRALGLLTTNDGNGFKVAAARKDYMYTLGENTTNGALQLGYSISGTFSPTYGTICFYGTGTGGLSSSKIMTSYTDAEILINVTVDDPTPTHVIEATRATALATYTSTASLKYKNAAGVDVIAPQGRLGSCGADVFTTFQITTAYKNGNIVSFDVSPKFCSYDLLSATAQDLYTAIEKLALVSSFDWHPTLMLGFIKGTETFLAKDAILPPFVDVYRAASVDKNVIARIHDVANMSLFDITLSNSFRH